MGDNHKINDDLLLDNCLGQVYPIIIEIIGMEKIWQLLYIFQLCSLRLSKRIPILIDYSLNIIKKEIKNVILPPNILAFLYPNITYSISEIKWCIPNLNELNLFNFLFCVNEIFIRRKFFY